LGSSLSPERQRACLLWPADVRGVTPAVSTEPKRTFAVRASLQHAIGAPYNRVDAKAIRHLPLATLGIVVILNLRRSPTPRPAL